MIHSSLGSFIRKNTYIILCSLILIIGYVLSPYGPHYPDLLKFFGYLYCFNYGAALAKKHDTLCVNIVLLYVLVFFPVFVVALFDNSIEKNTFFITPNTFVYTGLSMGLLYYLLNTGKKNVMWFSWFIVLFYVLICTSLGVVFAIAIAFLILNFKRKHIPYLIAGAFVMIMAIQYLDIPLFVRFRDVLNLWTSMSASDWKNLQDVNIYELSQSVDVEGDRTDNTSSIWRMGHWLRILTAYLSSWWCIPFGMGENYTRAEFGNAPHNDYVKILVEYGLIIFCFFVKLVKNSYDRLKENNSLIYFILPMFIYHFTENLIDTFPPNVILYFTLGWGVTRYNKRTEKRSSVFPKASGSYYF